MEYVDEDGEGFVCSLDASVDAAVLGEVSVMPSPSRPVIKNVVPVDCAAHKIDQSFPDILLLTLDWAIFRSVLASKCYERAPFSF